MKKTMPLANKPMRYANVDDVTVRDDYVAVPLIPLGNQAFLLKVVNQIDALLSQGWRIEHCRDWLSEFLKPAALRQMERKHANQPTTSLPAEDVEGEVPAALFHEARMMGLDPLPATKTHRYRMQLKSETSNRLYVISQRVPTNSWECSCPSWRHRRLCKHLIDTSELLNAPEFAVSDRDGTEEQGV